MRLIIYIVISFVFVLCACDHKDHYFNGRVEISEEDRLYSYSSQAFLNFVDGDTLRYYHKNKYDSIVEFVALKNNTYIMMLYSHVSDCKEFGDKLFITQIPNKYLFDIPDTLERRFTATLYSFMDPDEYSSKMQEIEKQPELYEYYYFDNSKTTLFGPYTKKEISEIAKSMGYHYPNLFN